MDTFGGDYMYLIPNIDEIRKKRKATSETTITEDW